MKQAIIITGVKAIDRKLKSLEPRVQKKVVRKSMRAGLKLLAAEVKTQIPVLSGLARSAVKVRAVKKRKRGSIELEVTIDSKTPGLIKPGSKPAFYPALIEYGDRDTPPDPFMRRSYEAKSEGARQVTLSSLLKGTMEEASK